MERPVAITADTSYIDWTTPFPGIAICLEFTDESMEYALEYIIINYL